MKLQTHLTLCALSAVAASIQTTEDANAARTYAQAVVDVSDGLLSLYAEIRVPECTNHTRWFEATCSNRDEDFCTIYKCDREGGCSLDRTDRSYSSEGECTNDHLCSLNTADGQPPEAQYWDEWSCVNAGTCDLSTEFDTYQESVCTTAGRCSLDTDTQQYYDSGSCENAGTCSDPQYDYSLDACQDVGTCNITGTEEDQSKGYCDNSGGIWTGTNTWVVAGGVWSAGNWTSLNGEWEQGVWTPQEFEDEQNCTYGGGRWEGSEQWLDHECCTERGGARCDGCCEECTNATAPIFEVACDPSSENAQSFLNVCGGVNPSCGVCSAGEFMFNSDYDDCAERAFCKSSEHSEHGDGGYETSDSDECEQRGVCAYVTKYENLTRHTHQDECVGVCQAQGGDWRYSELTEETCAAETSLHNCKIGEGYAATYVAGSDEPGCLETGWCITSTDQEPPPENQADCLNANGTWTVAEYLGPVWTAATFEANQFIPSAWTVFSDFGSREECEASHKCQRCNGAPNTDDWIGSAEVCERSGNATVVNASDLSESDCEDQRDETNGRVWWKRERRWYPGVAVPAAPMSELNRHGCFEHATGGIEVTADLVLNLNINATADLATYEQTIADAQQSGDVNAAIQALRERADAGEQQPWFSTLVGLANAIVTSADDADAPKLVFNSDVTSNILYQSKNRGEIEFDTADGSKTFIIHPHNYEDAKRITMSGDGDFTVVGGWNAGAITASTTGTVFIGLMDNSGNVAISSSQDVTIVDVDNSGNITMDGVAAASFVSVDNHGTVTITGGGSYSAFNVTNIGTISVASGEVSAVNMCNEGTITLGADVTGTVELIDACTTGTINGDDELPNGVTVTIIATTTSTTTTTTTLPAATTTTSAAATTTESSSLVPTQITTVNAQLTVEQEYTPEQKEVVKQEFSEKLQSATGVKAEDVDVKLELDLNDLSGLERRARGRRLEAVTYTLTAEIDQDVDADPITVNELGAVLEEFDQELAAIAAVDDSFPTSEPSIAGEIQTVILEPLLSGACRRAEAMLISTAVLVLLALTM